MASPAACIDYRCRVRCEDDSACLSGESCDGGVCLPRACLGEITPAEACEGWAHWRAMARCLKVPCPEAEADGRIDRILPENLADIPLTDDIDDDQ